MSAATASERRRRLRGEIIESLIFIFIAWGALWFWQLPAVQASVFAGPDDEMADWSFTIRRNQITGAADPILFLAIDEDALPYGLREAGSEDDAEGELFDTGTGHTPHDRLASLLDYSRRASPAGPRASSVLLDVDIGWPDPESVHVETLRQSLQAWSDDDGAPPLYLAREPFLDPRDPTNGFLRLDASDYDDIVAGSDNIHWVVSTGVNDEENVIRDVEQGRCMVSASGEEVGYIQSAALAIAADSSNVDAGYTARHAATNTRRAGECRASLEAGHTAPEWDRDMINFHTGPDPRIYSVARESRELPPIGILPNIPKMQDKWASSEACGPGDAYVLSYWPASIVGQAPEAFDTSWLCRRMVFIGADNVVSLDWVTTPYGVMPGTLALANAARGLALTAPYDSPAVRTIFNVAHLTLVAVGALLVSAAFSRAVLLQRRIQAMKSDQDLTLMHRAAGYLTHPYILPGIFSYIGWLIGIAVSSYVLNFGQLVTLAAPMFVVSAAEALWEFRDAKI